MWKSIGSLIRHGYWFVATLVRHPRNLAAYTKFMAVPYTGSITAEERAELIRLAAKSKAHGGPIVEIGTLFGFSTQALALGKAREQQLHTVDLYCWNPYGFTPAHHEQFTRMNLDFLCSRENVLLFRGSNTEFYDQWTGGSPSLVFIDAEHSYEGVKKDIEWALQSGANVISGHDYGPQWPGIVRAVQEYFGDDIQVVGTVWSHHRASQ